MTAVSPRSKANSRKAPGRRRSPRRKQINWKSRVIFAGALLIFGWLMWAVAARAFAPETNTPLDRFDAIVVLGYPADDDGNPTSLQQASVAEAAHEYERGVSPRLIVTGAAVANNFVEAQVLARSLEAHGIPEAAIVIEPNSRDTIQNACFAARIMKKRGWHSAEVIVSPNHKARTGIIFSRVPIEWRVHAAPILQPVSSMRRALETTQETLKTMRYLVWARWRNQCEP